MIWLPPLEPRTVFALGLNYADHAAELSFKAPEKPLIFLIVDTADIPDPMALGLRTYVNGEIAKEGNTRDMIFDIPALLEYLSDFMTLSPGDLILTGTRKVSGT